MAITPPTAPTAAPTVPDRADRTTFSLRVYNMFVWVKNNLVSEMYALAQNAWNNATEALGYANTATTQAGLAATQVTLATAQRAAADADAAATAADRVQTGLDRVAAAASAASAAAIAGAFVGTSTSSLTIGVGSKTFVTQTGEQYTAGIWISAVSQANTGNWMFGQVTSYAGTTLVLDVQAIGGAGTFADWNLSLVGARGPQGEAGAPLAYSAGADVGSYTYPPGASNGEFALLEGMGLYRYDNTSTEIADGETVVDVTTGAGRWLLMVPHWDFTWAMLEPLLDNLQSQIDMGLRRVESIVPVTAISGAYGELIGYFEAPLASLINVPFNADGYDGVMVVLNDWYLDTGYTMNMRYFVEGVLNVDASYAFSYFQHGGGAVTTNYATTATSMQLGGGISASGSTKHTGMIEVVLHNPNTAGKYKDAAFKLYMNGQNCLSIGNGTLAASPLENQRVTGLQFIPVGSMSASVRVYGIRSPSQVLG